MSKLYQRIEQIFRFRLMNNSGIEEYLKRMSTIGKIDDVKKIALFTLILTVLGEMEDKEETLPIKEYGYAKAIPDEVVNAPKEATGFVTEANPLKCPDCEMVTKSKLGLISHSRKHKKS